MNALAKTWENFGAIRRSLGRPLVVAHRGAKALRPENTLAAFALALEQGADALETDLRFTRDGQIVLHHDATLDRTTTGGGPVGAHTLAEIKQLYTRNRDGTLSEERIPTLLELIAATGEQAPLLLELKDPLFLERSHAAALAQTLAATGMTRRVALVSFHFDYVQAVQAADPALPAGFITMMNPLPKRGAQLHGPFWPLLYLNPGYVAWAHRQGGIVAPLDPNPEARVQFYVRRNVDALLADNPASVLRALGAAPP
jgi:glycerophosphoryl diester phosphodiesterase